MRAAWGVLDAVSLTSAHECGAPFAALNGGVSRSGDSEPGQAIGEGIDG
jgi:hypothetical protein